LLPVKVPLENPILVIHNLVVPGLVGLVGPTVMLNVVEFVEDGVNVIA